jgi:hypothetical protein
MAETSGSAGWENWTNEETKEAEAKSRGGNREKKKIELERPTERAHLDDTYTEGDMTKQPSLEKNRSPYWRAVNGSGMR